MAKTDDQKSLLERMAQMETALQRAGITVPDGSGNAGTVQTDRIEFGSAQHMAFLGLVEVHEGDDVVGSQTYTSKKTGRIYRLEDEVTSFMHYPDPSQIALLTLKQKVNEFEAGPPPIPANAPSLWQPKNLP